MPRTKKDGKLKRAGRPKKVVEVEDVEQNLEGVFVPSGKESGSKSLEPLPLVVSPVNYIEKIGETIVKRIDDIAKTGTLNDAVKLKANQVLLNKILPDLTRNEQVITESPYAKIQRMLEGGGTNEGNNK